jgi:predicted dehydrogenase
LREELSYFALCVLEGKRSTLVSAEDGLHALRVGLAVIESARADREVEVASIS